MMSTMGYCRFQNTLGDLRDCYDHIDDTEEMSDEEKKARLKLIAVCKEIADDHEDEMKGAL